MIPCYSCSGTLIRVKIRCSNPEKNGRYRFIPGGSTAPGFWGCIRSSLVVVESELDAILIKQEAADLVSAIALGSAVIRPDAETFALLSSARTVLQSTDNDEAGSKEAWGWWKAHVPAAVRWPIPAGLGKDPTEAFINGFPLKEWVYSGLFMKVLASMGNTTLPRLRGIPHRRGVSHPTLRNEDRC